MTKRKRTTKQHKNVTKLPRSIRRLFPNVTEAIDSRETVEVNVTKRDCTEGKKKNPDECAMARAFKREFKADHAIIGMSYSYLIKNNKALRFKTPESVKREIVSFDRHQDFAPGEYILTPPSPQSRLGTYHRTPHDGGHKTAKRKFHTTTGVRILDRGASY